MLLLLIPPVVKPCEPLLGPYSLARFARMQGIACTVMDCNLEWLCDRLWGQAEPPVGCSTGSYPEGSPGLLDMPEALSPGSEPVRPIRSPVRPHAASLARPAQRADAGPGEPAIRIGAKTRRLQRARGHIARGNALTRMETYENLDRYGQAIEHLETVLQWAHGNGTAERAGLANFEVAGLRVVSRQDLSAYAEREATVFDTYIEQRVLPQVRELQPHTIGFSFTFLHQGFALIRFAKRIRECYPAIRLILGGPMAACWRDADWGRPPLDLFDAVFSTWSEPRSAAAGRIFPLVLPPHEAFFPDLQDLPRAHFFAPKPILPMAFRLGCSYGGCRFCPDYQSRGGAGGEPDGWREAPRDR